MANVLTAPDAWTSVINGRYGSMIENKCFGNPHPDPKNPTAPWDYYVKKREEDQEDILGLRMQVCSEESDVSSKRGKNAADVSTKSLDKDRHKSKKARGHSNPVTIEKKIETTKRSLRRGSSAYTLHIGSHVASICSAISSRRSRKILDTCDTLTCAQYMRTFKYINEHAPYLGTLISRRKKCDELAQLIGKMQNMINHMRSEDTSRLKSCMGSYAAPNPDKELIHPPITDDSKSCAQMGFNHAQLGKLMKNKFDSASLKVTTALWPAFLYPGNTAGEDFDPEDIIEGLFRGYLLERVTKLIFTSPSSALKASVSSGTCACNAKLHGMKEVRAEHIAYVAVQARFAISSLEKWKDHDGLFYYTDFYTRIVNLIWGRKDKGWVNSLLGHYNEKLFGNENGAKPCHSLNIECSKDNDIIAMERQLAAHASRSLDTPSAPSSALDNQQESRGKSIPPPDKSPTPDPPIATSSPQELARFPTPDPPVDLHKAQEVLPARSSTPNPPDNSHKRKQASTSAIFDDKSPLTEEDEEITQPTECK
ncbi:uncharacterized protein EDB91DRAFT_1084055 [Suillus paluster]|uniref:uncharacterized protein n=1 Tax=Suillus paluster TaxID=48578 RepID=UPI001B866698|nr:uncharacterized protein EDB91DRAFT_1084055 [Suillus paluster]KAG1734395.1 hypothetical protein EDB91DRAFT_1084055 [Suillus paluster]